MSVCDKCKGAIINDYDFVYSFFYKKCTRCGKRFKQGDMMDILLKIPTRGRPERFFPVLDFHLKMIGDKHRTSVLISIDKDDKKMNNETILNIFNILVAQYGIKIDVIVDNSINKIDAINRDINSQKNWDILVLSSDDMIPLEYNFDGIIRRDMASNFPDLDGVLYYPDGYTPLNTLPILGKKYYNRFGYVYNQEYKSFFCDNEFHMVADILNKHYYSKIVLFSHEHPANIGQGWDEVYEKNNYTWKEDEAVFSRRKQNNFFLKKYLEE